MYKCINFVDDGGDVFSVVIKPCSFIMYYKFKSQVFVSKQP